MPLLGCKQGHWVAGGLAVLGAGWCVAAGQQQWLQGQLQSQQARGCVLWCTRLMRRVCGCRAIPAACTY